MRKFTHLLPALALGLSTLSLHAQTVATTVQAESGTAGADWATGTITGATYLTTTSNAGGTSPGTAARMVAYTVTFPAAGVYDLYARIRVGSGGFNDDSFYYGNGFGVKAPATDADWITVNGLSASGYTAAADYVLGAGAAGNTTWKWINLSKLSLTGTGSEPPITLTVPAGALTQTFQIGAREDGLQFDKFAFGPTNQYYKVGDLDNGLAGSTTGPPQPFTPTGPAMATGKPKFLGGIWSPAQLNNFLAYWNQVVPSNVGKWGSVEGTRNVFNWTDLDAAYALAKNNGLPFRFHVLTWGAQQPSWMDGLSPADQLLEIQQWYAAVAQRYPGIDILEVVNEPLHQPPGTANGGGNYVNALGGNGVTGYDWVLTAFRLARQYFPNTRLMLNDYSVANSTTNATRYLAIVRLLQRENLLDALGIQGHSFSTYGVASTTITNSLDLLASAGVPLYITELDIHGDGTANDDATQLAEYQRVFPLFWTHPAIKGMSLFGYLPGTDANSFLAYANGAERPALTWLKGYVAGTALPCNVSTTARLTNPTTASATNGAINLMAQGGGTAAYTYSWTGPNGFAATTEDLTGLAPGTYTVVVTAPSSSCTTTSQIELAALPAISLFAPATGPVGTSVVLTGTNLTGATAVAFNGTPAPGFVVNSATQITVSVPTGASSGLLAVTTPGGTASSATAFAVTRPLTAWTGAVSNDWFASGNWTAGVPTDDTDALVAPSASAPAIAGGTASAFALTIASGATLGQSGGTLSLTGNLLNNGSFAATGGTVATTGTAGQTLGGSSPLALQNLRVGAAGATLATAASWQGVLTLTGNLTTNNQPLTLRSTLSGGVMTDALVVNSGGAVAGPVTVQRAIDPSQNAGPGYRHFAPPVNYVTVADLATTSTGGSFTPVLNPAYNSSATPAAVTPFPTVFEYDNTLLNRTNNLSSFDKGWTSPTSLSEVLTAGNALTVNIAASEVVNFKGTLNTGDFVVAITSSRSTYADGGWRLLGNPYPSPLDLGQVAFNLYLLDNAMYTYASTGPYVGQYRGYVNRIGNGILPMGQGFFMRVGAGNANGTVTFRNSQRLTTASAASTFQRTTADPRPLAQLTLQGAGSPLLDEATVYFEQGATAGFDGAFDAEKLTNPSGLNLASVAAGSSQAINGLPLLAGPTDVPLTVGVPTAGTYTLRAASLANLSATAVYLLDAVSGQQINLHTQPSYSFTVSNAAAPIMGRFTLRFGPQAPLATQAGFTAASVSVFPNPTHEQLTVRVPAVRGAAQAGVALYNLLGQRVRDTTLALPAAGVQASFDVSGLPAGVYVLRVKAGDTTVTKQVIIN